MDSWRKVNEDQENEIIEQHHRCDIEAYRILQYCSKKQDITKWNEFRRKNINKKICLQGADFRCFFLKKINFYEIYLEGADFRETDCEGAIFDYAHCENTNFSCQINDCCRTNCEGAMFNFAYCQNAKFENALCKKISFALAHCEKTDFRGAFCESANFSGAHCEKAIFWKTRCAKANFGNAHCEMAFFTDANCRKAKFNYAYCYGTIYEDVKLYESSFINVRCSDALFAGCKIDDDTDFSNSNLDSAIIEPGIKAKLEQNIRRKNWHRWFRDVTANEDMGNGLVLDGVKAWVDFLCVPAVWFFWYLSDYGYSTKRVLCWFFIFIFLFASIYCAFPSILGIGPDNNPLPERYFFQMLAFSTSTMVTLGFGDINVAMDPTTCQPNIWGMLVVTLNLMVGYFMLAVLVTRLAILFQTLGPGHVVKKEKNQDLESE